MDEPAFTEALLADIRAGDAALDRGEREPKREIDRLRRAGVLTAPLPPALGGAGWGVSPEGAPPLRKALEALGGASLSVARLYEGHVNAVRLVVDNGSAGQIERVAEAVRAGALTGVWGADAPGAPVNLVEADRLERLSGAKAFASGLGVVSLAIVTARSAHGLQMVVVDATDPERHRAHEWDVDGMVGSRSGGFDCEGAPAGAEQRLGPPDALLVEPAFHGGIWRLVACYAGALDRIAREASDMARRRGAGDDPLMRHRLGEIALEAHTAALWSAAACRAVEIDGDRDAAVRTTLFAREAVEQAAVRQMERVERLAGTAIHRRDSSLGRTLRDLRVYLRQAQLDGKLALATSLWEAKDEREG